MPRKFDGGEFIRKISESDPKHASAVVAALALMDEGDEMVTSVGSIIKTGDDTFKIVIDDDIVNKGVDLIYDELRSPIDEIFGD